MYDIEISSDRFELEQAYRAETAFEMGYEAGRSDAALTALEQSVQGILERQDAQRLTLERFKADLGQTEEETALFTEWLS